MMSFKNLLFVIGILLHSIIGYSQIEVPKCGADKIKIEAQRNKVKLNNIRQKIKLENSLMGEAMTMNKKRTEVISFDKEGRIMEWAYYQNNTQVEAIYRYNYDSRGNLSELTLYSDIGNVLEKTIYSYNSSGFLSQETFFEAGNTFVSRSEYETNSELNTITETEYSANNKPIAKRVYYYSDLETGDIVKREVFKQGNKLFFRVDVVYNDKGEIDREDFFSSTGNLAYQFNYKYDVNGNNTEKTKYSPSRVVLQRLTNVYTRAGLERGITEHDRQGRLVSSVQFEYKNF